MKKYLLAFLIFLFLLSSSFAYADNRDTVVYKTATGDCYHSYGCYHLRSQYKITLEDAVKSGLRRCSHCNPPIPNFTIKNAPPTRTPYASNVSRSSAGTNVRINSNTIVLTIIASICLFNTVLLIKKK